MTVTTAPNHLVCLKTMFYIMFHEDFIVLSSFLWFHSVPEGVEDNISGALQFAENFFLRYGNVVPNFYIGSLKEAIDEAFIETDDVVSLWSWQTTFICFL